MASILFFSTLALASGSMGPLFPDTTLLGDCPMEPGDVTACGADRGPVADAVACQAACDAAPYCSGVTFHGPSVSNWERHCVFRIDGESRFSPCGAGCDHTSSNKTAGWVPGPPPAPPSTAVWLPSSLPWGKPKTFWFGANSSGLDNRDTLALISKFSVGGYGWQTGHPGGGSVGVGEMLQAEAATHLLDFLEETGNNITMIFEYRQIQVALRLFAQCALAADDSANEDFWLHDPATGALCLAGQPWGTKDPFWNMSNPDAANYWVNTVVGQLAMDRALTSGRGATFFDEVDQGECGYSGGGCSFSSMDRAALQAAKNAVYARQTKAMNAAGIVPIFSLDNRFLASSAGTSAAAPCALPQDDLATALQGTQWARFYENWPQSFWTPGGPDLAVAMVQNAMLESAQGIPNVLHSGGPCPTQERNITRPGPLGGPIEYAIGLYLTVAGPGTTISISNDWYDNNFCWYSEFDVDFGSPLGPAVRAGYTFQRNYTRSTVTVDVSKSSADVQLLA